MNIEQFSLSRKKAHTYWKEYVQACKSNPKDEFLSDMKKTYSQLKSGRKVVDITQVFAKSGISETFEPKLAIANAITKTVFFRHSTGGISYFLNKEPSRWNFEVNKKNDVRLRGVFPVLPKEMGDLDWGKNRFEHKTIQAPVPKVPASLIPKPKSDLKFYHVLWEVEEWKPVPPRDPYLLRRITPNMFVVVGSWNLTELERSVMRGRI